MMFHRFMTGRNSVSNRLNDNLIRPWDTFLADEAATQLLPSEMLGPPDSEVTISRRTSGLECRRPDRSLLGS